MAETKKILSFSAEHRWLSNFWVAPIELTAFGEFHRFDSSEQLFQMAKLEFSEVERDERRELFDEVASLDTPGKTKRFGRAIPNLNVEAWNGYRDRAMAQALKAKYSQHPELAQKLLDLDGYYLEEGNHWGDRYWGVDGTGQNRLGILLMALRDRWLAEREVQGPDWTPKRYAPKYFS